MSPSANLKVSRIDYSRLLYTCFTYIIVTSVGTLSNNNRFRFELDQSRGPSSLIGRMVRTKHVGTVGTL